MEEFVAKGIGGQLTVTPTKVIISRKGALGIVLHGLKGDKEIRIDQISSIQLKRAGLAFNGYIQFAYMGSQESKHSLFDATTDENTVIFNLRQQPQFLRAKELIEKYQAARRSPTGAQSDIDALEKLASLMEKGLITRDEFDAKKKQILGLS